MRRRGGNRNEDDQVHDGPPVLGDGRILDALEDSKTKNKDLLKLVRHVAVVERVWLSRLQGKGSAQYSLWEEAEDDPDDVRRKRRAILRLYRRARGIRVGRDDRLCEPERGSVPNVRPGHPVAGPLTWAISPGTDQPGTSDRIGRACPSRLHHVREALTGPNNHHYSEWGLTLNYPENSRSRIGFSLFCGVL
ncbi:hypothetical protein QFZ80_003114 [Paenibacillus sp. V4I7]|nr:hypothetical protein [Paenibacillus sp. V4I7]